MLPVTAASAITTPPPIVNTTIPGTNEVHAPPTTVAPSFSTAQLDNNARGNTTTSRPQADVAPQSTGLSAPSPNVGVPPSASEKYTLGAQTNFLAQLIGQDITPSVQGVLVQYEKLVNIGNVKYKPSDAMKPQAQPSNLFSQILQQDTPEQAPAAPPASLAKIASESSSPAQNPVAPTQSAPDMISGERPSRPSFTEEIAQEEAAAQAASAQNFHTPRAISAYTSTVARIPPQAPEPSEEPVSQVA